MRHTSRVFLVLALACGASCAESGAETDEGFEDACFGKCDAGITLVERSGPKALPFEDLVALSEIAGKRTGDRYQLDGGTPELEQAVQRLLDEPTISNEAFAAGVRPHRPEHPELGPSINAALWNIERGQQLPAVLEAFAAAGDPTAREAFMRTRVLPEIAKDAGKAATLDAQIDALAELDIVILNEVDRFMKRSGYIDVVAETAAALDMNYAFAVEFIEVDPIALGTETFVREDFLAVDGQTEALLDDGSIPEPELQAKIAEAHALTRVDPERSQNLHGNAILSRYPILAAKAQPLSTVCWDWNAEERKPKAWVTKGAELLAEKLFLAKTMREIRHGGRTMLTVDLWVPGLSAAGTSLEFVDGTDDVVTVVVAHLENRTTPKCRAQQMEEVLARIAEIRNPVILAGDLNTFGSDGRPTTIKRLLLQRFGNPEWVAKQLITRFVPYSNLVFTASSAINMFRVKDDPTGINIPLLLPNPERRLFDAVEHHVFADMARFDFRGDSTRTVNGTAKTLANSNERDGKGFKTTASLERTIDIGETTLFGKWKIDWMFVRGYARSPRDTKATYRMAPHFPRTLEELRDATMDPATQLPQRLSDHAAMTVVLPLGDTCSDGECRGQAVPPLAFDDVTWNDLNAD